MQCLPAVIFAVCLVSRFQIVFVAGAECAGPHVPVFHMVLKMDEASFFHSGKPLPTEKPMRELTNLRSCQRFEDQSCCTDDYFKQVDGIFSRETQRFAMIRDIYNFMVSDSIQPAVAELNAAGEADLASKASAVGDSLEGPDAAKAITKYMDECEEVIQKYFSASLCELCDPALDDKLTEDRYLIIDDTACQTIHRSCSGMPALLEKAAEKFAAAGKEFTVIESYRPEEVQMPEVLHAANLLSSTATLVELASKRIEYYKDEQKFCQKLNEEGYVYIPEKWGNTDLLHPSLARSLQSLKGRSQLREFDSDSIPPAPLKTEAKYGVHEPTKCVHGKLQKSGNEQQCVCEPCWSGNTCEVKVRVKPFLKQRFSPITAKVPLVPQSIVVEGCEMPMDLDSHFAHIKIIDPAPLTAGESQVLADSNLDTRDLCVVRKGAPPFKEVVFQVPVATKKDALEYLVHVRRPEDNAQPLPEYRVCFCFGPECFDDPPGWYTIGTIDVVPAGVMEKDEDPSAAGGGYTSPTHYVNERPCGQQWMPALDGHGIRISPTADRNFMYFVCMDDFVDMIGPTWIRCIDGEWFQDDHTVDSKSQIRKHWDGQLPTCRWKFDDCPHPIMHLEGGFVTVESGLARYVCQPNRIMHVDGQPWQAATYVRWCRPTGSWLPAQEPQCLPDTTPQVMPSSRAAMPAVPKFDDKPKEQTSMAASFLEVSAEAHHIRHRSDQHNSDTADHGHSVSSANSKSSDSARAAARAALLDGVRTKITSSEISGDGPATVIVAAQEGFAVGSAIAAEASDPASDVDLGSNDKRAQLRLHAWPTRFERTTDAGHSFIIDKCWITLECAEGQVPNDAAASPHFARRPDLAAGRLPLSVVIAAAVSVIVSMAAMAAITKSTSSAQAPPSQ